MLIFLFLSPFLNGSDLQAQSQQCTRYVATTGSDTDPGSEAQPWKTIQKAADSVNPGDVVCVRGGTYPGFTVAKSGTASQPITFRAYPGERPLINKPGNFDYIYITDQSHIILDGLIFDGVFVQIYGKNAGYNQILNCESRNGGGAIGIYWGHHNLIKNCKIYNKVSDNYPRGKATLTGTGIWGGGVMFARGATNNIIEDSYIYWIHGEGILAFNAAHGSIIRRNVIEGAWSANVYVDGSKDVTVDSNLIYLTPEAKTWPSIDPNRGNWSNSLGIGVSVECAGSGPCYYEDAGERSVDNLTITNNIVVNANGGIWLFRNDNPFVASGWRVINNTFINNDNGIYLTGVEMRNSIFKNNIVVQNNGGYQVYVALPGIGNIFSNNLYFGSAQKFRWGSVDSNLSGWISATGETGSQWTDPRLVNTSAIPRRLWNDPSLPQVSTTLPSRLELAAPYLLTSNSPALNVGTSQNAPSADFGGTSRPQGSAWDIGAYEYRQGDIPPDTTQTLNAPYSPSPIHIDGDLSDPAWLHASPVSFSNPKHSDNSVQAKALWDDLGLCFGYKVNDTHLEALDQRLWEDDGAEIYVDVGHEKPQTLDGNDKHFIVNIHNQVSVPGVEVVTVQKAGGYTMEIRIPWSILQTTPSIGKVMGFLLGNNDRDNGQSQQFDWLGIIDIPPGYYDRPNLWGDLVLQGAPSDRKGDLNQDGKVDVVDLGILLSNWGSTSKPPADLNKDGVVDVVDLGILLSNWG
jgi:hypothetical protein